MSKGVVEETDVRDLVSTLGDVGGLCFHTAIPDEYLSGPLQNIGWRQPVPSA